VKRYGPIRRGEIKVLRLAPEGGEKRGNKTVEEPPVSNKLDPTRDNFENKNYKGPSSWTNW